MKSFYGIYSLNDDYSRVNEVLEKSKNEKPVYYKVQQYSGNYIYKKYKPSIAEFLFEGGSRKYEKVKTIKREDLIN